MLLRIMTGETSRHFLKKIGEDVIKTAALTLTTEAIRTAFHVVKRKQEEKIKKEAEGESKDEKGTEENKSDDTG